MEAIILAGGLGTRLKSRISGIPKPMAPVAGRPFLEYLLNGLAEAGFTRVLLSVGYLGRVVKDHFGNRWRDVRLDYVEEETPLGTGGAIRRSMNCVSGSRAFVLNGDTWLLVDYRAMDAQHQAADACFSIALSRVADTARYGGVDLSGSRIVGFIEKGRTGPGWINAGVYLLSSDFPWPNGLPERFSFEADVLYPLLPSLRHSVVLNEGYFLDIGVPEDFDRAQTSLPGARLNPVVSSENRGI
jgi:D-glycero-alpha-D-manno-heptose 1-phosphate guanylyltransferase